MLRSERERDRETERERERSHSEIVGISFFSAGQNERTNENRLERLIYISVVGVAIIMGWIFMLFMI